MAASATTTLDKIFKNGTKFFRLVCDWTSASSAATHSIALGAALVSTSRLNAPRITGKIISFETSPGTSGNRASALPTALYDITLLDEYNYDVADGSLANRASNQSEAVVYSSPIPIDSELTLTIVNQGTETNGRFVMFFE